MAYDERLANRLRAIYEVESGAAEKKMFGGIAFMVNGHMSCGVANDRLMVRVGPDQYASALERVHAKEMDFTGRPMTGFVYVEPSGLRTRKALTSWVKLSLRFVQSLAPK